MSGTWKTHIYQHIMMFFKTWLLNIEKHTLVLEVCKRKLIIFLPEHLDLVIVVRVPGQPVVSPRELEPHDDGHHATGVQVHPGGGHPKVHHQGLTLRPVLRSVQVNKQLCTSVHSPPGGWHPCHIGGRCSAWARSSPPRSPGHWPDWAGGANTSWQQMRTDWLLRPGHQPDDTLKWGDWIMRQLSIRVTFKTKQVKHFKI